MDTENSWICSHKDIIRNLVIGYFRFFASFQTSKLPIAHFVVLSVFAASDRAATCSSITNAAKRVEPPVELPATVQEVWFALRAIAVGVAVVTFVSAPGQPVYSHRPKRVLEKGHAISLSPRL